MNTDTSVKQYRYRIEQDIHSQDPLKDFIEVSGWFPLESYDEDDNPNGPNVPDGSLAVAYGRLDSRAIYPYECQQDDATHYFGANVADYEEYYGTKPGQIQVCVESDFKAHHAWCDGEVYGYVVESRCDSCDNWVHEDSCLGFYSIKDATDAALEHEPSATKQDNY